LQSSAEGEPGYELHADTSEVAIRQGVAGTKYSLRRKVEIMAAGVFTGITAHVIYLFILAMMPVEESGAARLGERFASGW